MLDSNPRDKQVPTYYRLAGKWRFMVIMIVNIWLVFVIMRFGMARQQPRPLPDPGRPAAEYSFTTTLIASTALVGVVLAVVMGVILFYRGRSDQCSRLVIYRGAETPRDATGSNCDQGE
jgi:hypothetical protein